MAISSRLLHACKRPRGQGKSSNDGTPEHRRKKKHPNHVPYFSIDFPNWTCFSVDFPRKNQFEHPTNREKWPRPSHVFAGLSESGEAVLRCEAPLLHLVTARDGLGGYPHGKIMGKSFGKYRKISPN